MNSGQRAAGDRREDHVWYAPAPDLVRYETHAGRNTLTICHPIGERLSMFGAVAGVMATAPAVVAATADGSRAR